MVFCYVDSSITHVPDVDAPHTPIATCRVSHEEGRVGFDNRAVYAFARQGLEQRLAGPMPK